MSVYTKIPNVDFRRVIKFTWAFSYFSSLAKSHQPKTNKKLFSLSTSSNFFSQSVHKLKNKIVM